MTRVSSLGQVIFGAASLEVAALICFLSCEGTHGTSRIVDGRWR
jgi:hypothetical protein